MTRSESLGRRWSRRAVSIPCVTFAWAVMTAVSPVALGVAALLDLVMPGRRWARSRAAIACWWLLFCHLAGLAGALALWLGHLFRRDRAAFFRWNAALQRIWAATLLRSAARIYGLDIAVSAETGVASRTPYLLFVRHASVIDTLLPAGLIAHPHRLEFRYVLKRELLWNPCIDVVGQRLTNAFVERGSTLRQREVHAVRTLADRLKPGAAVALFPEGTRFSRRKLQRAIETLGRQGRPALLERARQMTHVLPPRPGGALALLDVAPELDIVFLAHTGLESATSLADIWRGTLTGKRVSVRLRRVAATEVPSVPDRRLEWLYDRWLEEDRWIASVEAGSEALKASPPR